MMKEKRHDDDKPTTVNDFLDLIRTGRMGKVERIMHRRTQDIGHYPPSNDHVKRSLFSLKIIARQKR